MEWLVHTEQASAAVGAIFCEFRPRVAELGPKETSQESEPLASFCCVVWLSLVRRLPWMDGGCGYSVWSAAFASIQPGVASISSKPNSLPRNPSPVEDGVCRFWKISMRAC